MGVFVGYFGCHITNFGWRFQYSGAGRHSPIFLHHILDPFDVVGNIGEDSRCRLRKDKFFGGKVKNSIPHLVTLIFHQLPTDNTSQNVPFFRTNNCQWPSAVPLLNHAKVMNAPEPQNTYTSQVAEWSPLAHSENCSSMSSFEYRDRHLSLSTRETLNILVTWCLNTDFLYFFLNKSLS